MMAEYGAERAGIGLEVGKIRGLGSEVKKGEKAHTGIVPFMQKWYRDLRSFSQGGIRNSSMTAYMPIWHINFDDFIVLKNNQGTVETRVRHVDYGIVLSAFFWRRYKEDKDITFFDPNQVPDLYKAFYDDIEEFERLYIKYEKDKSLTKKTTKAKYVFNNQLLKERSDTGRVYLVFIDNIINSTPFDVKTHPIVQSNLCVEILLPTVPFDTIEDDTGRIALCTLGSINLGVYKNPEDMEKSAKLLVRSLSNVLAYQDFLSIQAKLSNEEFEPLGIGITNLAYWMAKRGYKYGEEEALKELKRWIEHLSYYILEASVELAEERGPCKLSHTTDYAKGIFTWEKRSKGVNDLVDFTPELDWEPLRARMIKSGVKNAVQMAVAPVESSSIAMPGNGSTNGIEMPMALISVKESKAGSFIHVVPEYQKLKNKYQLMWEQTDCIDYIKTAAVINVYIDQSISTNTFYSPRHFDEGKIPLTLVAKNLMLAHKWGIKTFYYSLIEKLGKKDSDSSEDIEIDEIEQIEESCSSCVL
jgi:ribonucleoside-diphosphate reductase alpha chain